MEAAKEFLELILKILAVLGSVTGAGLYLLKIYFKQASQLEELKIKQQRDTVRQMKSDMDSLRIMTSNFENRLNEFRLDIQKHSGEIRRFEEMTKMLQRHWEKTAEQMEKRYQALEGAEIIQAGKNTFILKSRRQP